MCLEMVMSTFELHFFQSIQRTAVQNFEVNFPFALYSSENNITLGHCSLYATLACFKETFKLPTTFMFFP